MDDNSDCKQYVSWNRVLCIGLLPPIVTYGHYCTRNVRNICTYALLPTSSKYLSYVLVLMFYMQAYSLHKSDLHSTIAHTVLRNITGSCLHELCMFTFTVSDKVSVTILGIVCKWLPKKWLLVPWLPTEVHARTVASLRRPSRCVYVWDIGIMLPQPRILLPNRYSTKWIKTTSLYDIAYSYSVYSLRLLPYL